MEVRNYLSPCRNSHAVVNSRGNLVFVPCGHCPDCANRKANYYERLCNMEVASRAYTVYFTLTYNDDNVPKAIIRPIQYRDPSSGSLCDHSCLALYDVTARNRYSRVKPGTITSRYRLPEFGSEISQLYTSWSNPLFVKFFNKANSHPSLHYDSSIFRKDTCLRYLRKRDSQEFFKRLRDYINRTCPCKVSYFATGEYGPETFRPHIHVLLSFDEPRLFPLIEGLIRKSWQFGNVDYGGAVSSGSSCTSYVSGYLNSFSHLPSFLRDSGISPFCLHSQNYGSAFNASLRSFVYADPASFTGELVLPIDGTIYTHFPTTSFQNRFFPRCYGYDSLDRSSRHTLYVSYKTFGKQYYGSRYSRKSGIIPSLALKILQEPHRFNNRMFLSALDIHADSDFHEIYRDRQVISYMVEYGDDLLSYDDQIVNLFRDARSSRDFEDLLSPDLTRYVPRSLSYKTVFDNETHSFTDIPIYSGDSPLLSTVALTAYTRVLSALYLSRNFLTFCCQYRSARQVESLIDEYYTVQASVRLRQQYEFMEQYNKDTFDTDYSLFFPLRNDGISVNYFTKRKTSPYYRRALELRDFYYETKVKHKRQNDANLIFCT
ncbi:MAG: replication initiator protein [Microviridae sp.]|nr:MAG: replication initiator protein [Microviridae sp.]